MLFMGEWAASTPFPYFSDYHGELAEAVRKGRCDQLAKQDPAPSQEELDRAPNPQAEETLRSAQLRWDELQRADHASWFDWYKSILRVRREAVMPLLGELAEKCGKYRIVGPGALEVVWTLAHRTKLHVAINLCREAKSGFSGMIGDLIWLAGAEENGGLGPWSVRWSIEKPVTPPPDAR